MGYSGTFKFALKEKIQFLKKISIFASQTIGKAARLKFFSHIAFRA